jgi:hypothetical protein
MLVFVSHRPIDVVATFLILMKLSRAYGKGAGNNPLHETFTAQTLGGFSTTPASSSASRTVAGHTLYEHMSQEDVSSLPQGTATVLKVDNNTFSRPSSKLCIPVHRSLSRIVFFRIKGSPIAAGLQDETISMAFSFLA